MKRKTINVPIFNQKIILIRAEVLSQIEKWIEDSYNLYVDPVSEFIDAAVWTLPNGEIIIGFQENSGENSIIHETGHVVFAINKIVGLEYNEETMCYLLDWLYPQVKEFYDL